jgi:tetratricopeptide (TPR) repeat protein
MALMGEGRKLDALNAFDQALERDPENALAWANRGTVLLNLERYEEAVQSYERSLALRADSPYVYCSLATVSNRTGQPEKALSFADNALQYDPNFAPAMANKAKALKALGRHDEARELFERAFELHPGLRQSFESK